MRISLTSNDPCHVPTPPHGYFDRSKFFFHVQAIRHPLVVNPGFVDSRLDIHPKVNCVDDHLQDRIDDRPSPGASSR